MGDELKNDVAHQYARDVVSGKIVAGKYCRLACERYLRDLDECEERGMVFKPNVARAYLDFFTKFLRHTMGAFADQPFVPLPWQQFVLWNLYGWFRDDGTRRFNYAYLAVGRKNGKTTLLAGMAMAGLVMDMEHAAEIYFAATKRDQAKIGFNEAFRMATSKSPLKKYLEPRKHDILFPKINARLTYLSADKQTMDGTNPHLAIVDEYHAHATDEVSNVLRSGMQSRKNPLHVTITTAGFSIGGPCHEMQKSVKQILDGIKTDDSQFAIIYELDAADDWTDENVWAKANPSLGETISTKLLRNQYQQARNMGGSRITEFKTKHCNLWVQSSKTWIESAVFDACIDHETPDLTGAECWAGLDLASVSDMTALMLVFPIGDTLHVRGHYFMPSDAINRALQNDSGHIYGQFQSLPNMHITDGNVTDYQSIRRILSGVYATPTGPEFDESCLMNRFDVKCVAFDRYNSTQIAIDLTDDGVPVVPYGQGFISMSPPAKELEILIRTGRLKFDGDPVLKWALQNVELRVDPAGNIKPDKQKSGGKIDPIVALCMAIGERMKRMAQPQLGDDVFTIVSL